MRTHVLGERHSPLCEALLARMREEDLEVATRDTDARGGAAVVLSERASAEATHVIARRVAPICGRFAHVLVAGLTAERDAPIPAAAIVAAGATDVLLCEDQGQLVAEVVARIRRLKEVASIVQSHWIRERAVGTSEAWRIALERAVEVAQLSDSACALAGESGTGKELIARLIHDLDPKRSTGPFIVVDCTTLRSELAGSELFGHAKGAFTNAIAAREGAVALANGGTLFLDEIGELDGPLQAQLLRVIQEHVYKRVGEDTWRSSDFRLLCATNRDLSGDVRSGRFRRDLFYRVTQWQIRLPSLSERRTDVPLLARHFVRQAAREETPPEIAPEVLEILALREYHGNVRELRNIVMRMWERQRGFRRLSIGAIPEEFRVPATVMEESWKSSIHEGVRGALSSGLGFKEITQFASKTLYEIALERARGSAHGAGQILGVSKRAVEQNRGGKRSRAAI